MKYCSILILIIFLTSVTTISVMADESSGETEDTNDQPSTSQTVKLKAVTVVGSKENISKLPGSAAYLDIDDIRTHNYDDINRVLRKVAGVYLREEEGYGLFPNISLRGVDPGRSGKVSIMEDGLLTAPAPYSAPSAYYSPTTGRMSGIEVLKGSSQIKYGPHTTGGVINYLSTRIPTKAEYYLKTLSGTDNEIRAHAYVGNTIKTSSGKFGFLIENYYRETDGFKTIDTRGDFSDAEETGFRKIEPTLKLSWEPNTSIYQRFEAKVGYSDIDANESYLGLTDADFRNDPYRRYAASRFDNFNSEHVRSYLRHIAGLTPNLKVTTTAYYNDFHRNWLKLRGKGKDLLNPDTLAVWKGEVAGTLKYRNNNRDYYLGGIKSNLNYNLTVGKTSHVLDFGIRYHQDEVRRFQSDVDFEQGVNGNVINETDKGPGSGGNRRQTSRAIALFTQDRIGIGNFDLTPGIRYERVQYEYTDFDTKGNPDFAVGGDESAIDVVAPGIGVNYRFSDELSLFGGVYRGYSVPGPRANAKSGLKEETSIGNELGTRYNNLKKGFRSEAVLFYTHFDDLLVPENIGAGGIEGKTENVGNITTQGVEFMVGYDAGIANNLGFLNPYTLSFTYTNATLDGDANSLDEESIFAGGVDGAKVPYVPEFQFTVGTGIEFPRWGIFVDATYVDETFTTASNTVNQIDPNTGKPNANFGTTDSYFVIDVSGKYKITDGVNAVISLYNITDEAYIVSRHPIGPRPGKPFTVAIGAETKF